MKTRLTKAGHPVMGTPIEVLLSDGTWEQASVVGKGTGTDGHSTVMLILEWPDGTRQPAQYEPLQWRAVE